MALRFSIATALVLLAAVSWSFKSANATLVSVTSEWITGDHHGRVGGDLSGPVGSIFADTPPTVQFEFIYDTEATPFFSYLEGNTFPLAAASLQIGIHTLELSPSSLGKSLIDVQNGLTEDLVAIGIDSSAGPSTWDITSGPFVGETIDLSSAHIIVFRTSDISFLDSFDPPAPLPTSGWEVIHVHAGGILDISDSLGGAFAPDLFLDTTSIASHIVPEPGTLAVFGFGLAGLGWMRRRKAA